MTGLQWFSRNLIHVPAQAGLLVLLAFAALTASAQDGSVVLDIGGTPITVPVEPGYVRVSERSPELFKIGEAALPPSNRLVETFHTEPNLETLLAGGNASGHYMMVQVMREAETMVLSPSDWQMALPHIKAGMASWNPEDAADDDAARSERMSEAAGREVAMSFGELEKPTIYGETDDSVRFLLKIPMNLSVGSGAERTTSTINGGAAGAILLVNGKVLFLYWYAIPADPASIEVAMEKLDRTIAGLLALNAPAAPVAEAPVTAPAVPTSPTVEEPAAREGGSLMMILIGGVVLLVLVVGGLVVASKRKSSPRP